MLTLLYVAILALALLGWFLQWRRCREYAAQWHRDQDRIVHLEIDRDVLRMNLAKTQKRVGVLEEKAAEDYHRHEQISNRKDDVARFCREKAEEIIHYLKTA